MEKLLEKIDSYNIFTNIIPGAVLVKLLSLLDLYIVQVDGIVATIILYYFFGVLAGRIGSLVVGGILKACRVIRYTPREEYIKASQKDAEIKKLLEVNNMYRTFVGVFLVVSFIKLYHMIARFTKLPDVASEWIAIGALLIIFTLSFVKQTASITTRVSVANRIDEE
ncbi:MAG: hypothetical protein J6J18_02110 [Oscillospiraceae bacterium]|nr:hypothetical protein [Oscillospiraceae bacterium]MBP3672604.1 hypothetical protein [Oscillospiraceae bacterium]MDY5102081.1 hypothetical protein [Agathobacter sp.]